METVLTGKKNVKKNDLIDVITIEDMSSEGLGIGHAEGMAVFVKDTVIGDRVRARVVKVKKTYAYARLEELLVPGPDRVPPVCPVARRCGGCQIQEMSYEAQLRMKENKVRENLIRIGGLKPEADVMKPIIGMKDPWHYRNKAQFPVGKNKDGNIIAGFYAGRTHSIIDNNRCEIGIEENRYVIAAVTSWMKEYRISPYQEADGSGVIRHICTRAGFSTGQLMVVIVAATDRLEKEQELVSAILSAGNRGMSQEVEEASGSAGGNTEETTAENATENTAENAVENAAENTAENAVENAAENTEENIENIAESTHRFRVSSIVLNTNYEKTNVILGRKNRVLYGKDYIEDRIGPLTFRISAGSFYQVNPVQTEVLYRTALEYAGLTKQETVWDLYCGTGTISLFLAQQARRVIGIEVVKEAVEKARENARLNHIENCEFIAGKAEDLAGSLPDADVIVVDPPRKGLNRVVTDTILRVRPGRIVYVSCDSATLARDLAAFDQGGYKVRKVQPVDQFCHTVHVETVCLLERVSNRKADAKVHIDVDMEDYYRIKESKKRSAEENKE